MDTPFSLFRNSSGELTRELLRNKLQTSVRTLYPTDSIAQVDLSVNLPALGTETSLAAVNSFRADEKMPPESAVHTAFRRTFLRRHILQHLHPRVRRAGEIGPAWDGRIDDRDPAGDILALLELRQSLYQEWLRRWNNRDRTVTGEEATRFRRQLCRLTRPERFFYEYPPRNLYRPVRIVEHDAEGRISLKRAFEDLTALIRNLLDPPVLAATQPIGPPDHHEDEDGNSRDSQIHPRVPEPDQSHIVLTTRTGAGKTVACWKAFFDCLFPDPARSNVPMLEHYVPCWLRSPADGAVDELVDRARRERSLGYVVDSHKLRLIVLLALASGLIEPASTGKQIAHAVEIVRQYLTFGPNLLLFIDLNHVPQTDRVGLASAIAAFHDANRSDKTAFGWKRHRIVVAYRTTLTATQSLDSDPILRIICQPFVARRYDLEPLGEEEAVTYLNSIREFEKSLYEELREWFHEDDFIRLSVWRGGSVLDRVEGDSPPQTRQEPLVFHDQCRWNEVVKEECGLLRELIRRTQNDRESLISTPLLMHWVASIRPDRLSYVENITHLYHEIVYQHLERFRSQTAISHEPSVSPDGSGELDALTAMTRIALLMLQRNELRLCRTEVNNLLDVPATLEFIHDVGAATEDRFWTAKPGEDISAGASRLIGYYSATFEPRQSAAIQRCGLLREVNQQIGFLHDSLVYYFAGVLGLHHFRGPGFADDRARLPETWSTHVAVRIGDRPSRWLLAAEFLGGSLVPMRGLDSPFSARIAVSDQHPGSVPVHRRKAVHRLAHDLLLAPPDRYLPGLLLRLLRGFGQEENDVVLRALRFVLIRQGRLDLIPPKLENIEAQNEDRDDPLMFAAAFPAEQLAQDVFNFLYWIEKEPGACHDFACELLDPLRKSGRKWLRQVYGPRPRLAQTLRLHRGKVTCLAAMPDGRIVSAGEDGNIFAWQPNIGHVEHMVKANSKVSRLLVDADLGLIFQKNSSLYRWDQKRQISEILIACNGRLNDVVLGTGGQTLYAATEYGDVIGVDLTARCCPGHDPWKPSTLSLQGKVDGIDRLIPFRLEPLSNSERTFDQIAIVDQKGGRILRWQLEASEPVEVFRAEDGLQIREVVFDGHQGLVVRIIEEQSSDCRGLWHVSLTAYERASVIDASNPRAGCISAAEDRGSLADFTIDGAPVMFRKGKTKEDMDVIDVYRWHILEHRWIHVSGYTNIYVPVGTLSSGRLILRKRSSFHRAHLDDSLYTDHLRLDEIANDGGPFLTSHQKGITAWTVDGSGAVVSADSFGVIKRSIVDCDFRQDEPRLGRSQRGIVVDANGNFARCGDDWRVTGWYPATDSEFTFALKARPLLLTELDGGLLCVLDQNGQIHQLHPDRNQQSITGAAEKQWSIESLDQAVFSPSGWIAYLTSGVFGDSRIYRKRLESDTGEICSTAIESPRKLAIDARGNILVASAYNLFYWPLGQANAHKTDVRIDFQSSVAASEDGSWFFAEGGHSLWRRKWALQRWHPSMTSGQDIVCQHENLIGRIAVSKDGTLVVSADADESLSGELRHTRQRLRRAETYYVRRSIRDPHSGQWTSEVVFEFRTEVGTVGLTAAGDVFATSIDGTLQFASRNGERMRIETGEVIECAVADPQRPLLAFAAHEQEMTVLAVEPDCAECETLLPYRRDGHLGFLKAQLNRQVQAGAPQARIERFVRRIAECESLGSWSVERIVAAVALDASVDERFSVLLNVERAFAVVQRDADHREEFQRRLVRLMGTSQDVLLGPQVRDLACAGCVTLGVGMVVPLLAMFDVRSKSLSTNILMVLQQIAPLDERVDELLERVLMHHGADCDLQDT